jgi:Spy/CpxP family protein refolding chaperone
MKAHALKTFAVVVPLLMAMPVAAQTSGGRAARARAAGPPSEPSTVGGRGGTAGARAVNDPFGKYLFPPEMIMMRQSELGLTDAQRELVQSEVQKAQQSMTATQFRIAAETEKLEKLLQSPNVDETRVLAQVDGILNFERQVKRTHVAMLVRIRNALTEEQQAKLQDMSTRFEFDTDAQQMRRMPLAPGVSGGGSGTGRGGRAGGGGGGGSSNSGGGGN